MQNNNQPQDQEAPISLEQIKMLSMMVGGKEGIKGFATWGIPHAEKALNELYNNLKEQYKEQMQEQGLTAIGHTIIQTPKGGVGVMILGFKFFAPNADGSQRDAKVSYPLKAMKLEEFVNTILDTIFKDELFQ